MKLVHMGDSITFGQFVEPEHRWTSVVRKWLMERFCWGMEIHAVNCGVPGETTRLGLERFPVAVQQVEPQILTIQYGLNDCNCWETDRGLPRVSARAFEANLVEMIARARQCGTEEIILATNHPTLRQRPMVSGESYEAANWRYSEIVRSVAKECAVTLCDVRMVFERYEDGGLQQMLLPAPDQLHLSVEGNRMYAATIMPYVVEAVEAVTARRSVERAK
jgi:lysophospholipase L1-like esterase